MTDSVRRAKPLLSGVAFSDKGKKFLVSLRALVRDACLDIRFHEQLTLALVVFFSLLWAVKILPDEQLADEGFHWTQIVTFLNGGEFSTYITTIPGYHLLMTYLIKALSWMNVIPPESLPAARCLNWLLSLPALVCFYLMVRKSGEGNSTALSLQFFLSPIIFPFFFLVYTDMASVSLIMLAALLIMGGRYHLAAAVAGVSILFRQTNIMWLFLLWLLALHNSGFFDAFRNVIGTEKFKPGDCVRPLRKTFIFPVLCVLFAGFVIANEGVAVGDVESHTLGAVYPTQVFLLLCTMFFLFLPMHIKNAPAIWRLLKSQPLLPFIGAILYAVYIITFDATHDYNYHSFYLRNYFLEWLRESTLVRSLFFIPMLWAFYNLLVTPLRKKSYYWLYPVVVLYMLPIGLIEPRYFIVPVVLFMLFRKPENDHLEYLSAAIYIPVSIFFVIGIAEENFFL
ncbi:MAG TPA: hypothetical protein VF268_05460 [Gammaproteobacteria bacterium]